MGAPDCTDHYQTPLQRIVSNTPDLAALSARLAREPRIGLDTEFLRERTYRAQLCLVQLSAPDDVTGLVRPVFDTQIAAALTGLPAQIGYAEAVRRLLGRELAKSHTRTDWSRRPLSPAQIEYALDDVRYLLPLAARLQEQLARLGRLDWLAEELAALEDPGALTIEPDNAWLRIKGLRDLDPARARLARALAAWRERCAVEHDRPRGWILDDTLLREIVVQVPRTLQALAQIAAMPPGLVKRRGEELLAQVRAAEVPHPAPPLVARARPDPVKAALVKKLGAVSQAVAAELNLVPEVLATRRDLEQLADGRRDGAVLRGWRRAMLGERLLAAL